MEVKTPRKLSLLLLPSIVFSIVYVSMGEFLDAIIVMVMGLLLYLMFRAAWKKRVPTKVDYDLVTAIFHMYSLSMGETSPTDLVETIAGQKEYGFYSTVFQKVKSLAKDFGYGFTKATAQIAETVKPPLKDILVRCSNIFSTTKPRGYLEIESSMLIEEYAGVYTRSIETLKTLGGIFTTFQSVIIFLIMTVTIMTVFMIDPSAIMFGYIIAILSLFLMYFLVRTTSPKENIIYIGKYPPRLYVMLKWSFIALFPSTVFLACLLFVLQGPPYAFMVIGCGLIVPGVFGYKLEKHVGKIDKDYPAFLKSLGENLASTSDLKSAFSYILSMELGPLKKLVREALVRLRLGMGHTTTLEALSSGSASNQVHNSNKILLDALSRGANPLEICNSLGNRIVKFMEFRKNREVMAKSFQTITFVMQAMTVVLVVVLQVLTSFLSSYLVGLPYFGFNEIPVLTIYVGNIVLVLAMAVVNAFTVKAVSAGHWGSFLLNLGILLIISGATWIAANFFVESILGALPSIELPV